jgi:hypothetical protein
VAGGSADCYSGVGEGLCVCVCLELIVRKLWAGVSADCYNGFGES